MRDNDRFDNYRDLVAKFDSIGACGHPVKKGDEVGYNPRLKRVRCATCWAKWCAENDEARTYEESLPW